MRFQAALVCLLSGAFFATGQQAVKQTIDPHTLVLVGGRFAPLKYDTMSPEQKTMVDHLLAGERGGVRGPFNVLLRSPEVGDLAAEFGGYLRFHAALPRDVAETVILLTGRFWTAQYEWSAHKTAALQAGVKPDIIEAIAQGKRPIGMPAKIEAAYDFIDELLTSHQVGNSAFDAAKNAFGENGIVDMTGLSGWYSLVSMMLDVDRYPLAAGAKPELEQMDDPLPVFGEGFASPAPGPLGPKSASSTVNGKALNIRGDRFRPLKYDETTPAQKKYTEEVVAGRGPGATFNLFLRSPEAGTMFFTMGERVRFHMQVPAEMQELALAITARYWAAQTEWLAHSRNAVQAGLSQDKADAIAQGRKPTGLSAQEAAVYNLFTEYFKNRQVSDATFAAAEKEFGERGVVDLLVSSAYYQVVSMFMNVDRLPLANGQKPGLDYFARPLP